MPTYAYKAIDGTGRQVTDMVDAPSRASAIDVLTQQGFCPVMVEAGEEKGRQRLGRGLRPVRKSEVEAFTRELANLLAAGVPLSRALSILSREASRPAAKSLWATVHDQVAGGQSLADALRSHPKHFPAITVAMVRAGEMGGFLDLVLDQIATFRSREQELMGRVKAALVYPAVLAVLATAILGFLLVYFIPSFSKMFQEFGGALPRLTRAIVAASNILLRFWFVLVLAGVLMGFGFHRIRTSVEGRRGLERTVLRTPMLGVVVGRFALVRFCRMLGTLAGAGVPLVGALQVAKEAIGNQVLSDTVGVSIEQVQRGNSLARSLQQCPTLFPPSVVEMVAVAEESGRLDKELVRLAGAYEQELDRRLKMLVALAEPALLFIMAVLVGTVVIGMLLPIFNLQELIR